MPYPIDEPLTPQAYQTLATKLQTEFEQKIREAQAKGDFTALEALAANYQREALALANRLTAAALATPSQADATDEDEDDDEDDDSFPEDPASAQLMLLGAMYVEENELLEQLESVSAADFAAGGKEVLIGLFCTLDMGGADIDPADVRQVLADSWGVESKESLLTMLAWLLNEGHHKQLRQLIAYTNAHPDPQQRSLHGYRTELDDARAFEGTSPAEFEEALVLASQTAKQLPSAGIRGWDLVRYVHLIRLAYMGGLIPGNECWLHVRRLETVVAQEFRSWRELSDSYLLGYRWWSGDTDPFVDICQRLLDHPRSPWRVFGW